MSFAMPERHQQITLDFCPPLWESQGVNANSSRMAALCAPHIAGTFVSGNSVHVERFAWVCPDRWGRIQDMSFSEGAGWRFLITQQKCAEQQASHRLHGSFAFCHSPVPPLRRMVCQVFAQKWHRRRSWPLRRKGRQSARSRLKPHTPLRSSLAVAVAHASFTKWPIFAPGRSSAKVLDRCWENHPTIIVRAIQIVRGFGRFISGRSSSWYESCITSRTHD